MRTVAAAALFLCVACSASAEAGIGRLVVTGSEGSVTVFDPVSGDAEVLADASAQGLPVQATPSPDGETIVWSTVGDDGEPAASVHDADGTRQVAAPTVPFYYAFSPDGSRLALLGNDPEGAGVALMSLSLPAGPVELVDVGRPYFFDWHPDGDALAVHVDAAFLGQLTLDGGRSAVAVVPGPFSAPAWSPDGRLVAVIATETTTASRLGLQSGGFVLVALDPDDGSADVIAEVDGAVAFDLAHDRVAYVEGDTGLGALIVAGLDGGAATVVAEGDVVTFEWSPDGEQLLYTIVDEDGSLAPRVWDGSLIGEYPGYAPTGVFVTQYLPFWAQYTRTITQWAPDSSAFAYASVLDGAGVIMIQPLDGERRQLGPGEMVIWAR